MFVPCALMTYTLTCHGNRFVSARFGPAGGLSQPRRDTVDPGVNQIIWVSGNQYTMCPDNLIS